MQTPSVDEEIRYRVLRYVEAHPDATQRELARALGVSLGKANYCLRAIIVRGWVKVRNFRNSRKKSAYLYLLTAKGFQEKLNVTSAFLERKMLEHAALTEEIARIMAEMNETAQKKPKVRSHDSRRR
ncbi:MAG TPA: MarR family EPS-associated transcriptional regulator [Vicinamibacterales bacterium]|nr:MarR family EPS-associated transcriptional regulator [Thermoanaerobaculia bacterium]HUK37275.1 MarR family EPS-associated transcriptional regulator [Vicinamibacterales bacterium]